MRDKKESCRLMNYRSKSSSSSLVSSYGSNLGSNEHSCRDKKMKDPVNVKKDDEVDQVAIARGNMSFG